jgi:cytochrome c biogenesis protein CcdA
MFILLLTLSAIALLDHLSMVPLALAPLAVALGSRRPIVSAGAFLGGIFAAYFVCGVVIMAGAEVLFEQLGPYLNRLWHDPNAYELAAQIFIGLLLMLSPWFMSQQGKMTSRPVPEASPGGLFFLGATLTVLGIPGAVPYVAAVERIVSHDPPWLAAAAYLGFYNLIFVLPFLVLIGLRVITPRLADRIFQPLSNFAMRVVPALAAVLFFALGLLMVADGIGWFLGHPLIPVSP